MLESEEENKPYKYSRTFENSQKKLQVAEMDKAELESYVRMLLGVKDPKSASSDLVK